MSRVSTHFYRLLALGVVLAGLALAGGGNTPAAGEAVQAGGFTPLVVDAGRHDWLPSLRAVPAAGGDAGQAQGRPPLALPKAEGVETFRRNVSTAGEVFPMPQTMQSMPAPLLSFDGLANLFGGWPPDTQGDVGGDYYVQWINLHFAIWHIDRAGFTVSKVYGPVPGSTLFQGFGGVCEFNNDGDPITLYDPLAGRWFMSQFALPNFPNGPFYQCAAVSQSGDPLGGWYRYQFQMPVNKMNDYPKFGVWPDAYYMTVNQFNGGSLSWGGAGVAALEREAMLAGQPARMVYFDLFSVNSQYGGMLPADLDGATPPPEGAPGLFAEWDDGTWIGPQDALRLWEFLVDWDEPANSTFGLGGDADVILPTADVDTNLCNNYACIPQPGTSARLDVLSDRLMYRLQYRNFGGYETLVTNHTVDVDGNDHAGVHWFELRKAGGVWALHQEGVYAPDADHRWMGSAALDSAGNLALGYSVSSATTYPSVRYTGRLAGDPRGTLPQGEQSLVAGGGSQTGAVRWGDYSMMAVDPLDDCTFWFTQEYVAATGFNTWKTRIGAFRFPNCYTGPGGWLQGTLSDAAIGFGIAQARVEVILASGQALSTMTTGDGSYSLYLPVGSYTVTASAFGYLDSSAGVTIVEDGTTIQDFTLQPAPRYMLSGRVSDARTGWALYARLSIDNAPVAPAWSDPQSGMYQLWLPAGTYQIKVEPFVPGYLAESITLPLVGNAQHDFPLDADIATCSAPGYRFSSTSRVNYQFGFEQNDNGFTPQGTTSWEWGAPISGPPAAYAGAHVWATNLEGDYQNNEAGYLNFPPLDLPPYAEGMVLISWQQWLSTEQYYDKASFQVSKDGGATWQTVYGAVSGPVSLAWQQVQVALDGSYASPGFRARFVFTSDYIYTAPGWYIDDVRVSLGGCIVPQGSLVVGNVYDQNTGLGLVGAVVSGGDGAVESAATLFDPVVADGFYSLFLPLGSQIMTASHPIGYQAVQVSLDVPRYATVRQDFYLPAGWLWIAPPALSVTLPLGGQATAALNFENRGTAPAAYAWRELEKEFAPLGPFEQPVFALKPFRQNYRHTSAVKLPSPPVGKPLVGGEVLRAWVPQGVAGPWSIAYDLANDSVWVNSPAPAWEGRDELYEFRLNGAPTGRSYHHSPPHSYGPADLAVNWHTGRIWMMNVNTGIANCIFEFDPDLGYTGASICPGGPAGFGVSQRGLAYDPASNTWFAGSWNDLMIYRFDSSGTMLSAVNVGLAISGLAYNPQTQHLFVMVNDSSTQVYVLDVAHNYALVGQFSISQGFAAYAGAGLEFDCSGKLWAVDQIEGRVVQFEPGESASPCQLDTPWLSELPASGSLPGLSSQAVQVTFDAAAPVVDQPGVYRARLLPVHDTPYLLPSVPVTMTVTAPASWGRLSGSIEQRGYCDLDAAPAAEAQVTIQSSGGALTVIQSGADGAYQRWLDSAGSPYLVTVGLPGYLSQQATVTVTPGGATVQDFALHRLQPCLSINTQAISVTLTLGESFTVPVQIDNTGYGAAGFKWLESPAALAAWLRPQLIRPAGGSAERRSAPQPVGLASPRYLPGEANIIIGEGFESAQMPPPGWQRVIHSATTWELGDYAPNTGFYHARVVWDFDQDEWLLSPEMNLATGMLTFWSYGSLYWCRDVNDRCDLNIWIVVGEAGGGDDIFVGQADGDWLGNWVWSQSAFNLDALLPSGPVRIGFQYLGSDGAEIGLDDIVLHGLDVTEVPWLAESPVAGTIPALTGSQVVDITLHSSAGITQPGIYSAMLNLQTNDPVIGLWSIPVTMKVTLPDLAHRAWFPLILRLFTP